MTDEYLRRRAATGHEPAALRPCAWPRLSGATPGYADDLAFSAGVELARQASRIESLVVTVATEEGFRLNPWKTRLLTQAGGNSSPAPS